MSGTSRRIKKAAKIKALSSNKTPMRPFNIHYKLYTMGSGSDYLVGGPVLTEQKCDPGLQLQWGSEFGPPRVNVLLRCLKKPKKDENIYKCLHDTYCNKCSCCLISFF